MTFQHYLPRISVFFGLIFVFFMILWLICIQQQITVRSELGLIEKERGAINREVSTLNMKANALLTHRTDELISAGHLVRDDAPIYVKRTKSSEVALLEREN